MRMHAVITADIGNGQKREITVPRIEAYAISTGLDTDADEFSIDISDPNRELNYLLGRDTEVLVSIFTRNFNAKAVEQLHQGIADTVTFSSEDQLMSIKGRDYSAVAADSQAPPTRVNVMRPHIFIKKEANALGISDTLMSTTSYLKDFERDGSETYWESWYRIARNKKMWIWAEPNSRLIMGFLNYDTKASYFFGKPKQGAGNPSSWLKVTSCEIAKNTQSRIGGIWVYGTRHDDNVGFRFPDSDSPLTDATISSWVKRPVKIITSTQAKNVGDARTEAYEEIFESKVGAIEIQLTVATDLVIQQNQMAFVNLPEWDILGLFYIVGVIRQGGIEGNTQIVRLREKFYSLSGRIPPDPEEEEDPGLQQTAPGDVAAQIPGVRWPNAFASSALKHHNGWDYKLFLGVLLAICDQESSFRNVLQGHSDREWYPPPEVGASIPATPGTPGVPAQTLDGWKRLWANEIETAGTEWGVGPMQLTTRDYKYRADDSGGKRDEYSGGRWVPEYNIEAGAWALAQKLEGVPNDNQANIWIGVQAYNGSGQAAINYRNQVKGRYDRRWKDVADQVQITGKPGLATVAGVTSAVEGEPELIKKFVALALQQLGKSYVWGAEGPDTFDCSGLVMYCAVQVGLNRVLRNATRPTTNTLWSNPTFTTVQRDGLLHGDLVFFEDDLGHMGIYLSRGQFLHAPHTGDVVKISSMATGWYKDQYHGAKRMIAWKPVSDRESNPSVNTAGSKVAIWTDGAWAWKDGSAESGPAGGNWLGNASSLWLEKNPDTFPPPEGASVAVPRSAR